MGLHRPFLCSKWITSMLVGTEAESGA